MTTDNVSVLIAAYNSAGTIRRAVASALAEPEVGECILVDDGSRDRTIDEALLGAQGSPKLKIVSLSETKGPAFARNIALDMSKGDFVSVLDSDDFFLSGRLRRLLSQLDGADFLADDILIVPEVKATAPYIQRHQQSLMENRAKRITLDLAAFLIGNMPNRKRPRAELGFLKPLVRQSFLRKHKLRYIEQLRLGEDYALYVQALQAGAQFCVVEPCGYIAVERSTSLSSHHSAADLLRLVEFDSHCLGNVNLNAIEKEAFEQHRAATRRRADYARALELRAEAGLMAGVAFSCSRASSLPYMIREALHARVRTAASYFNLRKCSDPQVRYLIGSGKGDLLV